MRATTSEIWPGLSGEHRTTGILTRALSYTHVSVFRGGRRWMGRGTRTSDHVQGDERAGGEQVGKAIDWQIQHQDDRGGKVVRESQGTSGR